MSDKETENKKCDCDDPCDDCTEIEMSNLTGWIKPQPKDVDNKDQK